MSATQTKCVFMHSPELDNVHYPPECPFNTSRAGKTRKILASMNLLNNKNGTEYPPEPVNRKTLEQFHTTRYLDALQSAASGHLDADGFLMGLGTPDCPVFPDMYTYPTLATGATLTGADLIASGKNEIAFNPSGGYHHAHPSMASGFCYINDIVLACMSLAKAGMKTLFIDLDVHHCDGVQEAFYERSDIMTISLHESGKTLFPGTGFENETGAGAGKGFSVNVPLPVGTYDEAYIHVFKTIVSPLINAYNPDAIVLELGMDTLTGDPLAHLHLTNNAYAEIIPIIMAFKKPILATGGGGYNVDNTARAWALAWSIFCGNNPNDDITIGLGGVMFESTEWPGGLKDRAFISHAGQRNTVDSEIEIILETVKRNIFHYHVI